MRIYLVYDTSIAREFLKGWFFTEWGARRFVKKYGDQFWEIRYIEKSQNLKVAHTREYIEHISALRTGTRQKNSEGGYGV